MEFPKPFYEETVKVTLLWGSNTLRTLAVSKLDFQNITRCNDIKIDDLWYNIYSIDCDIDNLDSFIVTLRDI